MHTESELAVLAREAIRQCQYLCLATTDATGQPWATPLMFVADDRYDFYWTSAVDAAHSRNLESNPRVGIVVYDSRPIPGKSQAVYGAGIAGPVEGNGIGAAFDTFFKVRFPDPEERAKQVKVADFSGEAPRRIYRATVEAFSYLSPDKKVIGDAVIDNRVPINIFRQCV